MTLSRRQFVLGAGVGTVGLASGFTLSSVLASTEFLSAEKPNEADIGFCVDMSTHHIQALAMCQRVLGRDTGDAVQAAASEVLQTQSIEVGMMRAWLTDWGQSTTAPDTVMAWMGMNFGSGIPAEAMMGLASDEDMRQLSIAQGTDRGQLWLQLMRAHHVGGVHMASAAIDLVGVEKVRRLAQVQVEVQTYEIAQYDLLLGSDYV